MKLAFQIAKRFLFSAKKQTIVIILGIAIGVSVQVFIGSLISGLQDSLVDSTIGSRSQITISIEDDYISDYQNEITLIKNSSDNIESITPTISTSGSLVNNDLSQIVVLRGMEFETADDIYKLTDKLVEGRLPTSNNEIVLGKNLKDLLSINIDDTIAFESPVPYSDTYTVVGFFDFKVKEINNTWVLTNLSTVQTLINEPGMVSQIEMQLIRVFDAKETAIELESVLSSDYSISTWIAENEELLSGLNGQSISSLMIQIFVIISVVLGISSVLAITVLQKSRQLGILKAMGIKDNDASKIFLFEGLILGVFGALVGILLGIGLSFAFATFAVNPDGSPVIPLTIDYGFIALSGVIAIVASTVAALSPAIKSSKLSVIEVIRNG
ncbi:ABC transporter permease [Candidatus Izemoplasma sp. B36]|uniref:ABC transporter permease n=1 Tax=Candidatus Izemoplasma sp. B36 TaxID=3242468 RepID=UPI0035586089